MCGLHSRSYGGCCFFMSFVAGLMLRWLGERSRVQDWSSWSRWLVRTFVVEPRRVLEIDENGPVSVYSVGDLGYGVEGFVF